MSYAVGFQAGAGRRVLPHAAAVIVSAWAPSPEGCLAEAVRGLMDCYTDVRSVRPARLIAFVCDPRPDQELLVELLEQVIELIDVHGIVPVQVALARAADGGLVGEFGIAEPSQSALIGSAPKAVHRDGLQFGRQGSTWRAIVTVSL